MVSVSHEVLVELFRSQTAIAIELLRRSDGVDLPEDVMVESIDTAFNQIVPAECLLPASVREGVCWIASEAKEAHMANAISEDLGSLRVTA